MLSNVFILILALLLQLNVGKSNLVSSARLLSNEDGNKHEGTLPSRDKFVPTKMYFQHIPKCSGDSFLKQSASLMPKGTILLSKGESNIRWYNTTNEKVVVFLRSPISHVYSQFLECKYDNWGKSVTRGTNFPRGNSSIPHSGFDVWLSTFTKLLDGSTKNSKFLGNLLNGSTKNSKFLGNLVKGSTNSNIEEDIMRVSYNCYDPRNMETRYLTPFAGDHFTNHKKPDVNQAKKMLNSTYFLGLTDFYTESTCMFEYIATNHLPSKCKCNENNVLEAKSMERHANHNVPSHPLTDLTEEMISSIKSLTTLDNELFLFALERFSQDLNRIEMKTGSKILCDQSRMTKLKLGLNKTVYKVIDTVDKVYDILLHVNTMPNQFHKIVYIARELNYHIVAEIGVWKGEYALNLLNNIDNIQRYYMVDTWSKSTPHISLHRVKLQRDIENMPAENYTVEFSTAMKVTEKYAAKRVVLHGDVELMADAIPDNSLDMVCMNGGKYTENSIKSHFKAWWPKIKQGGAIFGHIFISDKTMPKNNTSNASPVSALFESELMKSVVKQVVSETINSFQKKNTTGKEEFYYEDLGSSLFVVFKL